MFLEEYIKTCVCNLTLRFQNIAMPVRIIVVRTLSFLPTLICLFLGLSEQTKRKALFSIQLSVIMWLQLAIVQLDFEPLEVSVIMWIYCVVTLLYTVRKVSFTGSAHFRWKWVVCGPPCKVCHHCCRWSLSTLHYYTICQLLVLKK